MGAMHALACMAPVAKHETIDIPTVAHNSGRWGTLDDKRRDSMLF